MPISRMNLAMPAAAPCPRRRCPGSGAFVGVLVAGCALLGTPPAAMAQQAYPEKAIRFIVNFPPGGPLDILARTLAEKLHGSLGRPVVVENKPGAGGNIGADLVAKSAADGYTVLLTIDTPLTINPGIYKSLPFKPADLRPVMTLASSGLMIGTYPGFGATTLKDLVAKGRGEPVSFSNAGNGSPGHMAASILAAATGIKANHILYRGNAPAVLAITSGEVHAGILATPGLLPQVTSGRISALAVTSPRRSPLAPDVPTVAEAGLPELEFEVLYAALVPAATPQARIDLLAKAISEALASPETRSRLAALDLDVLMEAGSTASARYDTLRERYLRTIQATGMQVE